MSALPTPPPPPVPLGPTYGAVYMSSLLTVGFWSISAVQAFTYFWRYPKDGVALKSLVASMFVMCSLQLGLVLTAAWKLLIAQFGDYNGLMNVPITNIIEFIPQLYVTVCVQGFFVWRIVKLTEKTWIIIVPWVMAAIAEVAAGLVWVGFAAESPTILTLIHDKTWIPGSVSLCVSAVVDVLLAAIMATLLLNRMAESAYKPSVKTLRRLLILSINSGTWTAAFAILDFALYWAYRENMIYVVFDFPVGALYFCTFLTNLNARRSTARMDNDTDYLEAGRSSNSNTAKNSSMGSAGGRPMMMMKVDRYHETSTDVGAELSVFQAAEK